MSPAPQLAVAVTRGKGPWLQVLPVHTPILRLAGEPKSQKRSRCGSQGSRSVHSSPSCLAHTRQQPQPSSTRLTPAGQRGAGAAHWHWPLQSRPEAACREKSGQRSARPSHRQALPFPRRVPPHRRRPPRGSPGAYLAVEGEQDPADERRATQVGEHGRITVDRGSEYAAG